MRRITDQTQILIRRSSTTSTAFSENLKRLRSKYNSEIQSETVFDPHFKSVLSSIFDSSKGNRKLPFSGVPTFLATPHRPQTENDNFLDNLDIGILGIPMDLGVTNRPGARFGPRAVRDIERVGPYNHFLKVAPTMIKKIADIGDVPFRGRYNLVESLEDIEAFIKRLKNKGVKPLSVGGDHSVTYPILKALGNEQSPIGLIHIDAHCDTGGAFDGTKFHHGGPMRLAVLDGCIDPKRTIQIGIRGSSEMIWEFSKDSGMTVIHIEDVTKNGVDWVIEQARKVVGDGPTYISFDVDGLDPSFCPGTGTPEVGGLTTREAQQIIRGLSGIHCVGGDVVELAPMYDSTTNSQLAAAQILFEILSIISVSPK